jgi:hypothetical protein
MEIQNSIWHLVPRLCTWTWTILAFRIFLFILWNVTEHVCVSACHCHRRGLTNRYHCSHPSGQNPTFPVSSQKFQNKLSFVQLFVLPLNISTPPLTNLSRNAGIRDCYIFDLGYKSFWKLYPLRDMGCAGKEILRKLQDPDRWVAVTQCVYCGTTTAVPITAL